MDEQNTAPVVIFYDRCVSQTHATNAIIPEFPRAIHLWVNDLFAEAIQRNDLELFKRASALKIERYPGHICFFVTCDNNDFEPAVKNHPAYGSEIHLIVGDNVSHVSYENGLRKMRRVADKIRVKLAELNNHNI